MEQPTGLDSLRTTTDSVPTPQSRLDRFAPLAGVGYAVLVAAGYLTIDRFPDDDLSPSDLTTYYTEHHDQIARGGLLLALSVLCFALFGAALWVRVQRSASAAVLAGGVAIGAAVEATMQLRDAATFSLLGQVGGLSTTDPAALQAWHVSAAAGTFAAGLVLFLASVGVAGILSHSVPRWIGWTAVVLAVLLLTPVGFFASLFALLWAAVAGIVLTMRPLGG